MAFTTSEWAAGQMIGGTAGSVGVLGAAEPSQSGLSRISDQLSNAAVRVESIATELQGLSTNIHGPRPEPVSTDASRVQGTPRTDCLASRVASLIDAVERLERSFHSVVR